MKYISLVLMLVIFGCKIEVDPLVPPTELKLLVNDENGDPVNGASVYIFDDESLYQAGSLIDDGTNAVYTGTVINGEAYFPDVEFGKIYWIHVFYNDGSGVHRSNLESQNKLLNPLSESSITTLKIDMAIDDLSRIYFWTDDNNIGNQPVEVFLENNSIGNLSTTINTTPTEADSNDCLVVKDVIPGVYSWYAKGQNGCLWEGSVTVNPESTEFVNLVDCDHGRTYFYTSAANIATHSSLTIVLDLYDTIPVPITSGVAGDPGCGGTGSVTIARPIGTHSYQVLSNTGTCIWTGTVDIQENGCTGILIDDCN